MQILLALLTMAGSALGAFLSVHLAFRRFRSERIWDARHLAYKEVIDAVEVISAVNEFTRANFYCEPERMTHEQWRDGDAMAKRTIDRHTSVSELLLSESFMERLAQFNQELYALEFQWNESMQGESEQERVISSTDRAVEVKTLAKAALADLRRLAKPAFTDKKRN